MIGFSAAYALSASLWLTQSPGAWWVLLLAVLAVTGWLVAFICWRRHRLKSSGRSHTM